MAEDPYRVRIEGVDWQTLLPSTRIFNSFRMATHPAKLALGMILAVLLYLGGVTLDGVWGPQVVPAEFDAYVRLDATRFQNQLRQDRQFGIADRRAGVFQTMLRLELDGFDQLIRSALTLDFGAGAFLTGEGWQDHGVVGALAVMVVAVPGWMLWAHPGFLVVYLALAFLLTALLGGAICRLAALHACLDERGPPVTEALGFTVRRYPWFILAPVIPLLVAAAIGLMLALAGLVFFNLPGLDVVGALIFGLLLGGGFLIAVILIALAAGGNLLWVAIAVEGTDAFDAISRAFNYVLGRPWRWLFYNAVMVVYGAITYLFVGLVVFLTLWVTKHAVGLWAFEELKPGVTRFQAIMPDPRIGQLIHTIDNGVVAVSWTAAIAAWLVKAWVMLLIAVLPAYALCFFFSAQTWIYLLLRRAADGTALEDVFLTDETDPRGQAAILPDKVEPVSGGHPVSGDPGGGDAG